MTTERETTRPAVTLEALLHGAIDYAGLFPPAQLDVRGAVAQYASYLASPDRWALGRFVVQAARLPELADAAIAQAGADDTLGAAPWRLSVLCGSDIDGDTRRVRAFNAQYGAAADGWRGRVEAIELRAAAPDDVRGALATVGGGFECYVEIPIASDPTALVQAIGAAGGYAKVRTGGVTADAFPSPDDLIRFIAVCVASDVPFKATAGLHHPLRGEYALTYAPDSARGTMYGYLNVMLATALLRGGAGIDVARRALAERDHHALQFGGRGVSYAGHHVSLDGVLAARESSVRAFGSCSFREPLDDLVALGLR